MVRIPIEDYVANLAFEFSLVARDDREGGRRAIVSRLKLLIYGYRSHNNLLTAGRKLRRVSIEG